MTILEHGPRNGLRGSYEVVEEHQDGSLLLRPESSDEVIDEIAGRTLDEPEMLASLERLHLAALREER